jgi:nucleoside-diphosphate-sugar epimerase
MIAITGIAGHSGRWLAARMERESYDGKVRLALRPQSDATFVDKLALKSEKFIGDLGNPEFLDRFLAGADTVIHIANIKLSNGIVDAAIRNGVRRAILVHTTGRFSRFKSAASQYIEIEDRILGLRDKLAITVLRPTMIYGSSRDRNMYKLVDYLHRHTLFPIFGSGNNLMQPVHARDLGNAYYDVLMNPGTTVNREYDLPGKEPLRYVDLVRTVSHQLGKRNVLVHIPMWLSVLAARAYNRISSRALVDVEQVMRMNEDKAFAYDAATRDFGYSPVSFPDGIRGEVEEYLLSRGATEHMPVTRQ